MRGPPPHSDEVSISEATGALEQLALAAAPLRPHTARQVPQPTKATSPGPPSGGPGDDSTGVPQAWAEQTLRFLLESLPDAMLVINRGGAVVLVNARVEELFGYPRQELLGQSVELLVPDRYRAAHVGHRLGYFVAPRLRPMGTGLELYGKHKDGSEFPVEISLSPLQTEHGTLITAVIRDITQRKREEAKFRLLVETIPAVTFIAPLDDSAPEFYVSPQIEQLLGFSQKEWLEDPVLWHRQLHPDDQERWNLQFAPTCATGKPFSEVYRFLAKDGRVVWVHGFANMVRNNDGHPLFLQGIAFDITAIKEAEEAMRRFSAELERRVDLRTEELAASMTELQEKSEELEQFAYVASHDLREPLRTLVNYPQRLIQHYGGQFDEQARDWITRIKEGAERMRRLIDSLSHYSRAVRRDRAFVPVQCAALIQEARANLQGALEEGGVRLTVGDLPTVLGNQQQLMLLFQNLVGNAIKFSAAGRPACVEVGARREESDWLFWVRDNGIGIEARYLKRIFGLGERLHPASKYQGTGFGLAICEKIVVGHGGRIWAESQPAQGTTLYFTLPAGAAVEEAEVR